MITNFTENIPIVKFLNGIEMIIGHNTWKWEENGKEVGSATQIPLKVAYALTIHKSQGCSLDYAEINLSNIFEYGQAYVALSRVKSLDGLKLVGIKYKKIKAHPYAIKYYKDLSVSSKERDTEA